jgi:YebC/PmpR family DNA-binding regulatory protein
MVAAKMGGADPGMNARLFTAIEKAKKESVAKDVIERAVKKGAGTGDEKLVMEHVVFEGKTPHGVPVIIECYTDNVNRTAPEMRKMFKEAQLGVAGANKFLFDHVALVEAHHPEAGTDREAAAIEAGANEVETLGHDQNDDIPEGACGARFICERTAVHTVAEWLKANGWNVVTSEIGYVPKQFAELTDDQRAEVGEFLQQFEDHDDVHRVWAALK